MELDPFSASGGTVRFTPDRPLPPALVEKLVRARIAEVHSVGSDEIVFRP